MLYRQATDVEAMLVALEHMQINWITVDRIRLHKFFRNCISFPQDIATFFGRMGVLRQYRVGERVISSRGPGGEVDRPARCASQASKTDLERFAVDEDGSLVFPAKVKSILADGRLVLEYDFFDGGEGVELPENVRPRVQMPWHPHCLKGSLVVLLRRNVGHGKVLEGLEVRWGYVANLMQALTRLGRWHAGGAVGPMHKYYDPRLFDVLSEEEVRWQYAPKLWEGEYVDHGRAQQLRKEGRHVECVDARTAEELLTAGVDVPVVGSLGVGDAGGNEVEAAEGISRELFSKWLELREMRYGLSLIHI